MSTKYQLLMGVLVCVVAAGATANTESTGGDNLDDHQVTMTWVSGNHRYASIDGSLYAVGDVLPGGARIAAIDKGAVTLVNGAGRRRVDIADAPPDQGPEAGKGDTLTPLTYLDQAIMELDRALAAHRGEKRSQARLADLRHLRDRLVAARDRLSSEDMTEAQKKRLRKEISKEWLEAQVQLDALRHRVLDSGKGLDIDQLRSAQRVLETATLGALRGPLEKLEKQFDFKSPKNDGKSAGLVDALTALLGSYPDYQALADKLEQLQQKPKQ